MLVSVDWRVRRYTTILPRAHTSVGLGELAAVIAIAMIVTRLILIRETLLSIMSVHQQCAGLAELAVVMAIASNIAISITIRTRITISAHQLRAGLAELAVGAAASASAQLQLPPPAQLQ